MILWAVYLLDFHQFRGGMGLQRSRCGRTCDVYLQYQRLIQVEFTGAEYESIGTSRGNLSRGSSSRPVTASQADDMTVMISDSESGAES